MNLEEYIGLKVKQLRANLSLREFAIKCDVSHTTIDNIEKGFDFRTGKPTQVKVSTLIKIASACNVPIGYFFGITVNENNTVNAPKLTEHELSVIDAYRSHPEFQPAVCHLLGVEEDGQVYLYTAAHSNNKTRDAYIKMDKEAFAKIQNAPETDEDLM